MGELVVDLVELRLEGRLVGEAGERREELAIGTLVAGETTRASAKSAESREPGPTVEGAPAPARGDEAADAVATTRGPRQRATAQRTLVRGPRRGHRCGPGGRDRDRLDGRGRCRGGRAHGGVS
jgi:hypothetical protein